MPRLQRIALLTHEFAPFRGGIGRVAEGLARGAVEGGRDPVVLAPDYGGASERDEDRPYRIVRFPGRHCSIVSQRKLMRYARQLHGLLGPLEPELIHAVCPASQMALTALSWFGALPAPHAFTVHGTELIRYRDELVPRLWMRRAFRRTVGIAVVSRAVESLLHDSFRVPDGRSFVSHPGIDPVWHTEAPTDREQMRRSVGAGPDDFVVLTVARRVPEKGHDRVIQGLAGLSADRRGRLLYVVAGTGPDDWAMEIETLARASGVRLHLTGKVPDIELVRLCDAADLFAMLSRRTATRLEGFGLTYLEAGRRGCPSLACDTGGVSEAVLDGETGILLPEDASAERVTRAIVRFLDDPAFRERAGGAARRWAADFTYRRHAREVFDTLGGRLSAD